MRECKSQLSKAQIKRGEKKRERKERESEKSKVAIYRPPACLWSNLNFSLHSKKIRQTFPPGTTCCFSGPARRVESRSQAAEKWQGYKNEWNSCRGPQDETHVPAAALAPVVGARV